MSELVGWGAAAVLLFTVTSQSLRQWRARSTEGVSPWLFSGQLTASTGFTIYSIMLGDTVFIVTNVLLMMSATVGLVAYWRKRRTEGVEQGGERPTVAERPPVQP